MKEQIHLTPLKTTFIHTENCLEEYATKMSTVVITNGDGIMSDTYFLLYSFIL